MFNIKPIALVGGTVVCAVGFLLFIPLITEFIYQTESWESYAVPILLYLIVGGSLVIINRNVELKIDPDNIHQCTEISKVSWFPISESIQKIRPYNEEKKKVLRKVNKLLKNNNC